MKFLETGLAGSYEVIFEPFADSRGWFARTYCKDEFREIGFEGDWVQINHSFTSKKGTIRGMHFQLPPYSEVKMVRCIAGSVRDVIIDLRKGSPTFLQHKAFTLSPDNHNSLFIPEGFAHGFQSLVEDTQLIYLHSTPYAPGFEGGLRFDDPALGISWPIEVSMISDRDLAHPMIDNYFNGI